MHWSIAALLVPVACTTTRTVPGVPPFARERMRERWSAVATYITGDDGVFHVSRLNRSALEEARNVAWSALRVCAPPQPSLFDLHWAPKFRAYRDGDIVVVWDCGGDDAFGTADDEFAVQADRRDDLESWRRAL